MKNILLFLFLISSLFAKTPNIQKAVAVGIFDENGNGENIQHKKFSDNDYNGICFSKIVVFGKIEQNNIDVKIGNSIGHFIKSIPIYSKEKHLIAHELTYKHFNITKGYFSIKIDNKLFDTKVFIK